LLLTFLTLASGGMAVTHDCWARVFAGVSPL
jgi:hypothetical protein